MYKCQRCGYLTKYKGNLKNHFNRKRICKPLLKNIEINNLINNLIKNVNIYEKNVNNVNTNVNTKSKNVNTFIKKMYECKFCKKQFKYRQSKCRHESKFCKIKKGLLEESPNVFICPEVQDDKDLLIKRLMKEKEELKKEVSELIDKVGNINTNNIIIYIII